MEEEIWKDIPNYEGIYQVSILGRVRNVRTGNILKPSLSTNKKYLVNLCKNGKRKVFEIHLLVAYSFLNHKPCGHNIVVDHIDNNPLNNKLNNLQLISQRENATKDKNPKSGKTGVSFHTKYNKFVSRIKIKQKQIFLGCYLSKEEASEMYQKAVKNVHFYNGCNKTFRELLK